MWRRACGALHGAVCPCIGILRATTFASTLAQGPGVSALSSACELHAILLLDCKRLRVWATHTCPQGQGPYLSLQSMYSESHLASARQMLFIGQTRMKPMPKSIRCRPHCVKLNKDAKSPSKRMCELMPSTQSSSVVVARGCCVVCRHGSGMPKPRGHRVGLPPVPAMSRSSVPLPPPHSHTRWHAPANRPRRHAASLCWGRRTVRTYVSETELET